MKRIGVLLSGNGVYDGSEIHEAVSVLIAIAKAGAEYVIIAPDVEQHHVINHLTGEEMPEKRNVLVESARIARGNIQSLSGFDASGIDALVMPGGFGAAKNLSKWAVNGPAGEVLPQVKQLLLQLLKDKKPIAALCISPVVLAKALEGSGIRSMLTVGTDAEPTPYNIDEINEGLNTLGASATKKSISELAIDEANRIVSAPCYMQDTDIASVFENATAAVKQVMKWIA